MKSIFTSAGIRKLLIAIIFSLVGKYGMAQQLGIYEFNGGAYPSCPNTNNQVTVQPANATFSAFNNINGSCVASQTIFNNDHWGANGGAYNQFSITATTGFVFTLSSLSFTHQTNSIASGWSLKSSLDNYSTIIASGTVSTTVQTSTVNLPTAFTNLATVTFRLYLGSPQNNQTQWSNDNVIINGQINDIPANPGNPTSNSPQCVGIGVTLVYPGAPPAGETWYWQTSPTGINTTYGASTYTVFTSGSYYLRSQDNTTMAWSTGAGTLAVVVTPDVSTPVFNLGANSTRCQGPASIYYTATASNNTGFFYSLDAASIAGNNSISSSTGLVTYDPSWTGTSIINVIAYGCDGPLNSNHTVVTNPLVTAPVFPNGTPSVRCQGAGVVSYIATATTANSISYVLDAASLAGGNTINSATGAVTYAAGWSGTSIITATSNGCTPLSTSFTVTITPTVGAPLFNNGATSFRCQGAGTTNCHATSTNNTGITYGIDATSSGAGNSVDATGLVNYQAGWTGVTTITATATGCNGPVLSNHYDTTRGPVSTPVFTNGLPSARCQGGSAVTYTATALNTTGITYTLDAASITGGNTIIGATGKVTYSNSWYGTSIITASATGCFGPATSTFTVVTTQSVGTPVFGTFMTPVCQAPGTISYPATAVANSGIVYSLNGPSITGGNTINSATGDVTYSSTYTGNSQVTATASGCGGPLAAHITIAITPSVGATTFPTMGATSTRCQGAGTKTYTAAAANSTFMAYALDAASSAAGNTINSSGLVTYTANWSGTTTITATASGCNGPTTTTHVVTITPTVGAPVFMPGLIAVRCQGAGSGTYTATATNTTGITYSLDAASISGGNSIVTATGVVTYSATWSGASTITASAAGCNGPATSTFVVTITPTVGTPVYTTMGLSSSRCQAAAVVHYAATSTNNTGLTFSLDAASLAAGNTINSANGDVTYTAGWTGVSTITATATGCNGPVSTQHHATTNGPVTIPVFASGATSARCQASGTGTFVANASNTSAAITYSLDASTLAAGNSINAATGIVTYSASWTGVAQITASAPGCYGPQIAMHADTTKAIVGTPAFTGSPLSTRCQGTGSITYTASATTSTGITYSLDATSLAGGNTINSATGQVYYSSGWYGASIITASAAGCSGPKTNTFTVTTTASVGIPVFTIGAHSARAQGAGTVIYTATATTNTGITYSIDAASAAAGTTINAATGVVTYTAAWVGTTTITATATGCSGPAIATHIAVTNPNFVITSLYLSDPAQALDRIDPVATGDNSNASTANLHTGDSAVFTMAQGLLAPLTLKANNISILNYVQVGGGTLPVNPNITATLKYGTNNIIVLTNPVYNGTNNMGTVTWTSPLGADMVIPTGSVISMVVTNHETAQIKINYDSQTYPSRIDLPVSTYITTTSLDVYTAPYPGGIIRNTSLPNTNNYVRATVTDPFGVSDITSFNISIIPAGVATPAAQVASSGATAIYEYNWLSSPTSSNYIVSTLAKQGFDNSVSFTRDMMMNICSICPPHALNDSASGAGGAPVIIDVLANDYDLNNNINPASLTIMRQPVNGSAIITGGKVVYIPNGSFNGVDQFEYGICDLTSPTPLCDTADVKVTIDPTIIDPCTDATQSHVLYVPYPEADARTALLNSQSSGLAIDNMRTIISIKCPYPNMIIVWDQWEDGYEANPLNPTQSTTQVWGDGNPYNGIAPGYPNDIIPAGGSIVLDNTIPVNPRVQANMFYDGKDKIYASGQISMTQVSGEPSRIGLQCMKTDIASTKDFGTSFTVPCGQDFPSQDFAYTALFIRAAQNNTTVNIDKNNDGLFDTTIVLNEGQSYLVDGGVLTGATVTSSAPIGVDLHIGGIDSYSSREVPLYPASWYSNTYYSPVPTTGSSTAIKDTNVVMLYNSLNRPLTINWTSGIPTSGSIVLPPKTAKRFALDLSQTAAYKFVNPTGESFTAIQICDSYTPGGGGNSGSTFDWAFNLIAENRLTSMATTAWAPGSTDGTRNDNPIWVTPSANTTIYVKYDGNLIAGTKVSPCGLHYDTSYVLNVLNHKRLKDLTDNDQSGLAVYTCDGTKLAAVYGEDPSTAVGGAPSWDVGVTIRPFCSAKLIFANDDYAFTQTDNPVTIPILKNDYGFNAIVDPNSVSTTGLLQPKHGSVIINPNGTILYTPNPGYQGMDTLQYSVCSTPSPIVCDNATVYIRIASCPAPTTMNIIGGQVFLDTSRDGINNDGRIGYSPAKVYLYTDGNCNGLIDPNELTDSISVDNSGTYQFVTYPEKTISDNFESCASGSTGNTGWASNWVDAGDPSVGFCVSPAQNINNTKAEIVQDGVGNHALRLKGNNVSATRTVNLNGAAYAFLTFSYRRATTSFASGENIIVQASSNGTTFGTIYTIAGTGAVDPSYVTIYNQDISAYSAGATTWIRFLTNGNHDADSVFIDNVSVRFLKYPQCYITQLSASSISSNYLITTPTTHAVSLSGTGTCISPFDFGVARKIINVSGMVWDDANGNLIRDGVEANVNGLNSGSGILPGNPLFVNLVDTTGLVLAAAPVQADGSYSLPNVPQSMPGLVLQLSSNAGVQNASMPAVQLPVNWVTTGENKNGQGGSADATPDSKITLNTGSVNITAQNFGIERLPDTDPKSQNYGPNVPGTLYTIPSLSGSDPEDGIAGSGNKYRIMSLPAGAVLYYNSLPVIVGQVITNYNPSLLQIDPADITFSTYFDYALIDAAQQQDPTPARVNVVWGAVLPIESLPLTGLAKDKSNLLSWSTESGLASDYFELQNSHDGVNFSTIANVSSKGTSSNKTFYSYLHHDPTGTMNFYRVKLIKVTGEISYSNTVLIKSGSTVSELVVMPNPFMHSFSVAVNFQQPGKATLRLIDMYGKPVKTIYYTATAGANIIKVDNLNSLPSGSYVVEIRNGNDVVFGKVFKIE